jgi:hypothetical protein
LIHFPASLEFFDGSAFTDIPETQLSVQAGSPYLSVHENCCMDSSGSILHRYFGNDPDVLVCESVTEIGGFCFAWSAHLQTVIFESLSHLKRIGSSLLQMLGSPLGRHSRSGDPFG